MLTQIEYRNMARHVALQLTVPASLLAAIPPSLAAVGVSATSVNFWPPHVQKRVLLLDPAAAQELAPADAANFDYLLFGGILGDDPPQDRTRMLRDMGFSTRHLGSVQMTTDTAVLVAQQVLEYGIPLGDLSFVDHPEVRLRKKEYVQLPFR